eukprot:m.345210 g.345210  ORF g.345210 m.345210 type:complete len:677 (+) comp25905_c0_seq1:127-2157(+)
MATTVSLACVALLSLCMIATGKILIIDDSDKTFTATGRNWQTEASQGSVGTSRHVTTVDMDPVEFSKATWEFIDVAQNIEYDIFLTWQEDSNFAEAITVEVRDMSETLLASHVINQTQAPVGPTHNGATWERIVTLTTTTPIISIALVGNTHLSFSADGAMIRGNTWRNIDASNSNRHHPTAGVTQATMCRAAPPLYADNISAISNRGQPSARAISNAVADQSTSVTDGRNLSGWVWQWGQFVDHDIVLTGGASPKEAANIPVPLGDPYFDPMSTGTMEIGFSRSQWDATTGTSPANPRQQFSGITAFVDASNVYGSDVARATWLREHVGGRLKTTAGGLYPPLNTEQIDNAMPGSSQYVVGDVRGNEQVGLLAVHTMFVREHNRIAAELATTNPDWSDEQIYQRARRLVGGLMQVITYEEFLPSLFGGPMPTCKADCGSIPCMVNEFAASGFRVGHTMITENLFRVNETMHTIPEGHISLAHAFFNPSRLVDEGGVEPLFRGLAGHVQEKIDTLVVNPLRNFLFGAPGSGGLDLASLNIQRGRDHGIPCYNDVRKAYGLAPKQSFSEITSDATVEFKLASMYASPDVTDTWVGILSEDHLPGASVGETVKAIIENQFLRLCRGDAFFYTNTKDLLDSELANIKNTRLSDIIRRNTGVTNFPDNVFVVTDNYRITL